MAMDTGQGATQSETEVLPKKQDSYPHRLPKILLWPLWRILRTKDPRDTVDRLFDSRHVNDLRLIAATVFVVTVLVSVISLVLAVCFCIDAWGAQKPDPDSFYQWVVFLANYGGSPFIKFFGPTLVLLGAVLAWAYQVGSARLGVVDLFACEIDTLCRVVTVTGTADTLAHRFGTTNITPGPTSVTPQTRGSGFSSAENYFPILDNNSRDLQSLEADVVINITAFYTFMKAVRDVLRKLADPGGSKTEDDVNNLLYMLYLALESGRKAMDDLVEFEPTHIERTVVILLSELAAYEFLRQHYSTKGDSHYERLILRGPAYGYLMTYLEDVLCRKRETFLPIMTQRLKGQDLNYDENQWWAALQLLPSLEARYEELNDRFELGCEVEGQRIKTVKVSSVITEAKSLRRVTDYDRIASGLMAKTKSPVDAYDGEQRSPRVSA
jgi:hypothetical protein